MKLRFLLGAAAFVFACHEQTVEYTTELQPIINGFEAAPGQFPAVGLLDFGGSICTGTLIEPDWVLTAAHCTAGSSANGTTFNIGNGFGNFTKTVPAKKLFTHPQFRADAFFLGNDIALVELETPITDIAPIPFNDAPLGDVFTISNGGTCPDPTDTCTDANGNTLSPEQCAPTELCFMAVGFGNNDGNAGTGAGTKRFVNIPINSFSAEHINYGLTGNGNTCQGDSGGPAFVRINGQLRVIGVTSGGAFGCTGDSFNQRSDTEFDDFLDPTINGGIVEPPPACVGDGQCDTACGITDPDCNCQRDGFCQAASLCPADIERDPDCPPPNNAQPEEGCTVSPASERSSPAPLAIFALTSLAFAVLGIRRRR